MYKILLTGGGTAGHVTPNLALIQAIKKYYPSTQLWYVGTKKGIERALVAQEGIPYFFITTGKLRRYMSLKNLLIPFQLGLGILKSFWICYRLKPTLVFSKGGFVSLPITIAAWMKGIPIIVHESDTTAGLANRLSFPLAQLLCTSFNVMLSKKYHSKTRVTGLPLRQILLKGNTEKGLKFLNFHTQKPILFIWAGSMGSLAINQIITQALPTLLKFFQIVHLCGSIPYSLTQREQRGYRVFDRLPVETLTHVLACTTLAISRAGATALYELLTLKIPHVLCPLPLTASRGEQIKNAQYTEKLGCSTVLYPHLFNVDALIDKVFFCQEHAEAFKKNMEVLALKDGTHAVLTQIFSIQHNRF